MRVLEVRVGGEGEGDEREMVRRVGVREGEGVGGMDAGKRPGQCSTGKSERAKPCPHHLLVVGVCMEAGVDESVS